MANLDPATVDGFGAEWRSFDQAGLSDVERRSIFEQYFSEWDWDALVPQAEGFDLGCGSGRWAQEVAGRVGRLHCIDASADALAVASRTLRGHDNCVFHHAAVDRLPLADDSMDFGYCLGVLHHVPDTAAGLRSCVQKLRIGAPLLVYLYYALDGRPWWFRTVWRISDTARRLISRLPHRAKLMTTTVTAVVVYLPLARAAALAERLGRDPAGMPLSFYRHRSLYVMRTDALDRLGTRLEQRFTKAEIRGLLQAAGLEGLRFREGEPFWCCVGTRAR